jgi:hypothetical protein
MRQVRLRRLRDLREQLAAIPGPFLRPSPNSSDGEESEGLSEASCCASAAAQEAGETGAAPAAALGNGSRDVCSICQEEVAVWVALRPCGHTACRDCIIRLAEHNLKCHICRGPIYGVQPVYI